MSPLWRTLIAAVFAGIVPSVGAEAGAAVDTTGAIEGSVLVGKKMGPPYINVVLIGSRQGAITDEKGRFAFRNIPPGHWKVRAMMIGVPAAERSVNVSAGKASQVTLRLEDPHDAGFIARHRTRPNRGLIHRVQESTSIRAFRIASDPTQSFDSTSIFRAFRITNELPVPPRENVDTLAAILEDPRLYGGLDTDKKLCSFNPGVGLLLSGSKGTTKALICLRCAQMGLWSDPTGPHASVDFQSVAPAVRKWVAKLLGVEDVPEDVH
ncbi:MAG TPA: carboxypeptidase regulatory-like domain-containing protein [Candidatus Eisenbacteria bacterium]|nr:carboxypeptidase regulatory-like domain-containing protein [Candidatus Eisenbacteria bacterium]